MGANWLIPDSVYPQLGDWNNAVSYAIGKWKGDIHIPALSAPRAVLRIELPPRRFEGSICECYGDVTQVRVGCSLDRLTRSHRGGHLLWDVRKRCMLHSFCCLAG
jgi:hypothetical protein